jgi:hypothetical protein
VGGQRHAPAALASGKENQYPLYRRLGRLQGRSGRVRKIWPPPGFDPLTVQPIASRYTDSYPGPPPRLVHKTNICHLSMYVMLWELVQLCQCRSLVRLPPTVGEDRHGRRVQSNLPCHASFTYGRYAASAVRNFLSAHLSRDTWLTCGSANKRALPDGLCQLAARTVHSHWCLCRIHVMGTD